MPRQIPALQQKKINVCQLSYLNMMYQTFLRSAQKQVGHLALNKRFQDKYRQNAETQQEHYYV